MMSQLVFLLESLSATFMLWLGVYIITRDLPHQRRGASGWQRPPLLVGVGTVLFAIYLFGIAMEIIAPTPAEFIRWQRITWWTVPLATLLFLWSVILLTVPTAWLPYWQRVALPLLALLALLLSVGIFTGFIIHEEAIQPSLRPLNPYATPMDNRYRLWFDGAIIGELLLAAVLLCWRYWVAPRQTDQRSRFALLAVGGCLVFVGGLINVVIYPWSNGVAPKQIGDLTVTAGAMVISYGIARYNALAHEQLLAQDFLHSLSSTTVIAFFGWLLFLGLFRLFGYPLHPVAIPLLGFLAVLTQSSYHWEEAIADRLLLPRWLIGYRSRLVMMRQELLTAKTPERVLAAAPATFHALVQQVQLDELQEMIQKQIDELFQYSHFADDQKLAESTLHDLKLVQTAHQRYAQEIGFADSTLTAQQRAFILRSLLTQQVDALLAQSQAAASGQGSAIDPTSALVGLAILRKKYVDNLSRTEVEHALHATYQVAVTGGAYSRALKQGRDRLARALFDQELTLGKGRVIRE
jgi:hypothetical protein